MESNENQYAFTDEESVEQELTDETAEIKNIIEKPFDPTKIIIETKTPSLDTLIKRIEQNAIQMDTSAYFQRRDDLWDTTKQSRLIESILIRFPLPAFFFDASNDRNWLVVDGLQRLSSIRNFCVTQKLSLTNLEFLTQLEGDSWKDIGGDLRRLIEETQVVIYKIMPGTPTDVKFNIFKRINTGGLLLEPQEIRHALFQGAPADFIARLAKNEAFIDATMKTIKDHRMLDRDFANRFLAFYLFGYENYTPDLDTFMSKAMANINHMSKDELDKIYNDYTETMRTLKKIFGETAFRKMIPHHNKKRTPINKALFDSLSAQVAVLSQADREKLIFKQSDFKQAFVNLLSNDAFFWVSITSSTGDKKRVYYRHNEIKKIIHQIIKF